MRTPREIYKAYKIMPNLQLHQLRVAAVGKMACDHFTLPIDTKDVVLACLFHDMGNIVKFDLGYFPEALEPKGLAYWQGVKDEFLEKYGKDQHAVSKAIATELGLSERVIDYIGATGFSHMQELVDDPSYERKLVEYADSRVAPYGIRSMEERWRDGRVRYMARKGKESNIGKTLARGVTSPDAEFERLVALGYELERQLFEHVDIKPQDINDAAAAPLIEELWEYPVP